MYSGDSTKTSQSRISISACFHAFVIHWAILASPTNEKCKRKTVAACERLSDCQELILHLTAQIYLSRKALALGSYRTSRCDVRSCWKYKSHGEINEKPTVTTKYRDMGNMGVHEPTLRVVQVMASLLLI
jgi:hypothetical protein